MCLKLAIIGCIAIRVVAYRRMEFRPKNLQTHAVQYIYLRVFRFDDLKAPAVVIHHLRVRHGHYLHVL